MSDGNERRGEFARVSEAAEWAGISRQTVYALMAAGKIAYVQIGGTRRIRWTEMERFIAANTHEAVA